MPGLKNFKDKEFDKIKDLIEKQMNVLFVVMNLFYKKIALLKVFKQI